MQRGGVPLFNGLPRQDHARITTHQLVVSTNLEINLVKHLVN